MNVEECTRSKSILSALGPIAKKIIEMKQTRSGVICENDVVTHLIKQCESFELACDHLKDYLFHEAKMLKDDTWVNEITEFHQCIISSVKCFTESTHNLNCENDVNVRVVAEVWTTLIANSETILEDLIKLMLSWDKAHLRQIVNAADMFLRDVHSVKEASLILITTTFQEIVHKVINFFQLIEKRCSDICRKSQREMLYISSLQLHKLLRILGPIAIEVCQNRSSRESKVTRDFVIAKIEGTVVILKRESGLGSATYDLQEPGNYINTLNSLFDVFNIGRGVRAVEKLPVLSHAKTSLEVVLQHCICVSQCVSATDRTTIMSACEDVLHQMKLLSDIESQEYPDPADVDVLFDVISDVLEILEVEVNCALIKFIVQTFTEPFLTLETILTRLKAINSSKQSSATENYRDKLENDVKLVKELIDSFEEEVDRFYQIGGFVIACISDAKKIRLIETSLAMLNWLESGLLASILKIAQAENDDDKPQSLSQVSFLSKEWMTEVISLRNSVYSLMENHALVYVTKQEIYKVWVDVSQKVEDGTVEKGWLKDRTRRLLSLVHRILTTDKQSCFLHEGSIKDLNLAVSEFRRLAKKIDCSVGPLLNDIGQSLVRRIQCLLTTLSKIDGSSGKVDPFDRENSARQFEVSKNDNYSLEFCSVPNTDYSNVFISDISEIPFDVSHSRANDGVTQKSVDDSKCDDKRLSSFHSIFKVVTSKTPRRKSAENRSVSKIKPKDLDFTDEKSRNISIDITKFLLSRSNTFRSSSRASKRNFSLKVKEINLDIGEVVKITPRINAPKYISPLCNSLEDTLDEFTDIIRKMERFTSSLCNNSSDLDSGKTEASRTFAGTDEKKRFPKQDLFYHTFHPQLPQVQSDTNDNTDSKQELVLQYHETERRGNSDSPLNDPNVSQVLGASSSSFDDWSIHLSDLSAMDTPSSLNISTPQRMNDINNLERKLDIMNLGTK